MPKFAITAALTLIAFGAPTTQEKLGQRAPRDQRGAQATGFDQKKSTQHFYLYPDGGEIDIAANDADDKTNLEAIRAYLSQVAKRFSEGNFEAPPLVRNAKFPSAAQLGKLKERITYRYLETPNGGQVNITTTDAEALKAVHAFLKFQITDHKTRDSLEVSKLDLVPSESQDALSRCLPAGIKLDDVVGTTMVGYVRPENSVRTTVAQALGGLGAVCRDDKLMDTTGREIYFYHRVGCWGNPPQNYGEILQKQQDELDRLKKQYTVVEVTCNPSGAPIR